MCTSHRPRPLPSPPPSEPDRTVQTDSNITPLLVHKRLDPRLGGEIPAAFTIMLQLSEISSTCQENKRPQTFFLFFFFKFELTS